MQLSDALSPNKWGQSTIVSNISVNCVLTPITRISHRCRQHWLVRNSHALLRNTKRTLRFAK